MSAVHLAGNHVLVGRRILQRCLICGHKLIDINLDNVAVPEGMDSHVHTWEVGAWVEEDSNRMALVSLSETPHFETDELPEHCCIELVEN